MAEFILIGTERFEQGTWSFSTPQGLAGLIVYTSMATTEDQATVAWLQQRGALIAPMALSEVEPALLTGVIHASLFRDDPAGRAAYDSVYQDLLERPGDGYTVYDVSASGAVTVASVIDPAPDPNGPPPVDPVALPEMLLNVALLYGAGLGRQVDVPGLNYWLDRAEAGITDHELAASFLDSAEFVGRFGDDDGMSPERFVDVMYLNVLGRTPDGPGAEYWVDAIAGGASHEAVLRGFANSAENRSASSYLLDLREVSPGVWDFV